MDTQDLVFADRFNSDKSSADRLNPLISVENAINNIFPTQCEDNKFDRFKRILGSVAITLSDSQIETVISEFQFLIGVWLDEYEKEVFSGLTLKQVLNES